MDYSRLLEKQERFYEKMKDKQIMDPDSRFYGIYLDSMFVCDECLITVALPLYVNPASRYYKDPELLRKMTLDIEFWLSIQQPTGIISLLDCNINSTPDTAFHINDLALSMDLIDLVQMPELADLGKKISTFLERSIPGMSSGGFHTPNHRWVIASALARLYARFHDERLKTRVFQYLGEQLDINETGEWSERSNAQYNSVLGMCIYKIGEVFNLDYCFEAVRKNLTMMEYMLHANNCVVTEFSSRGDKDRGKVLVLNERYAVSYLTMAARDHDPRFADMAQKAIDSVESCGFILHYLALYEKEFATIPPIEPVSDHYTVLLNGDTTTQLNKRQSGCGDPVLRYRSGKLSMTLMAGQPQMLYFQYGDARAYNIKLPIAWFGLGPVSFPAIEKLSETRYRMFTPLRGSYRQVLSPEEAAPCHGSWFEMSRTCTREDISKVETEVELLVTLQENGVDLDITCCKLPYIFTQLVCQFDTRGRVYGDNLKVFPSGVIQPQGGTATYRCGDDCISVSAVSGGHKAEHIRFDLPDENAVTVAFNALSPENWHVEIRGFDA